MFEMVPNALEYIRILATENLLLAGLAFWCLYVCVGIFSLPGAGALTIASGAIFGFAAGGILSSTSAWTGAMIIFLIITNTTSTYFQRKIEGVAIVDKIVKKIKEHEFKSMLFIRCTPIFPFFVTNVVAGVIGVSTRTYAITTAIGMFWSFIYAGVGAGLFEVLT